MKTDAPTPTTDYRDIVATLRADRNALHWDRRRAVARSLRTPLSEGHPIKPILELVHLFAEDPKAEVRKEVCDLLQLLPQRDFARLAVQLSNDRHDIVQTSAQRALTRRCPDDPEPPRRHGRRRSGLLAVQDQLGQFAQVYGRSAAEKVRFLADKQVDTVVSVAVHDLRGVLTPLKSDIRSLLTEAEMNKQDPAHRRNRLRKMDQRLALLERFVNDLHSYSQAMPQPRKGEHLGEIVQEAVAAVLGALQWPRVAAVELTVNLPGTAEVMVTRHQIVAALTNILKNAYDALESAGRQKRTIAIRGELGPPGMLTLSIEDNGSGISTEGVMKLQEFTPGLTTKKNRGTGYGLPTANRYVTANGGAMGLESQKGIGTKVTITLPMVNEEDGV